MQAIETHRFVWLPQGESAITTAWIEIGGSNDLPKAPWARSIAAVNGRESESGFIIGFQRTTKRAVRYEREGII